MREPEAFLIKPAFDEPENIRALFGEYTDMLVENDPTFAGYLVLQNFDAEIEDLRYKYAPPDGRLYIAMDGDRAAGCIALKRFDAVSCELKRLYVRPEYRGRGLASELTKLILREGRAAGYEYMLLDTLPFLEGAKHLYKKLGFYEIQKYLESPMEDAIYMRYDFK